MFARIDSSGRSDSISVVLVCFTFPLIAGRKENWFSKNPSLCRKIGFPKILACAGKLVFQNPSLRRKILVSKIPACPGKYWSPKSQLVQENWFSKIPACAGKIGFPKSQLVQENWFPKSSSPALPGRSKKNSISLTPNKLPKKFTGTQRLTNSEITRLRASTGFTPVSTHLLSQIRQTIIYIYTVKINSD